MGKREEVLIRLGILRDPIKWWWCDAAGFGFCCSLRDWFDTEGAREMIAVVEPYGGGRVPSYAVPAMRTWWDLATVGFPCRNLYESYWIPSGLRRLLDRAGIGPGDGYLFWLEFPAPTRRLDSS